MSSRLAPYVDERRHQARLLDEAVRLLAERGIAARRIAPVGSGAAAILAAAERMVLVVHGPGGAAAERPAGSR